MEVDLLARLEPGGDGGRAFALLDERFVTTPPIAPALFAALVEQATVEDDALALAGQIRALDELGHGPASWFASWRDHPGPEVGTAAVVAVARRDPKPPGLGELEQLARGRRRPGPRTTPWAGAQHAAWAHWRVTGDPGIALEVLGRAAARGPGGVMLPYLAELGPLAGAHADAVRAHLLLPGSWNRVESAHAWWRITGDAAVAVPVLAGELESLAAVRYLRAMGGPLPTPEGERRLGSSIHDDEAWLEACSGPDQGGERA